MATLHSSIEPGRIGGLFRRIVRLSAYGTEGYAPRVRHRLTIERAFDQRTDSGAWTRLASAAEPANAGCSRQAQAVALAGR